MNRILVAERMVLVGLHRISDGATFLFQLDECEESLQALRQTLGDMAMNGELKWKEAVEVINAASRELAECVPDDCGDEEDYDDECDEEHDDEYDDGYEDVCE
jgi:hypothetical protein